MTTPAAGRPSPWARLCLLLLLSLVATACSGGEQQAVREPAAAPATGEHLTIASKPFTTRSGYGKVYGRLPQARRKPVRRQVTRIVEGWWEAAFLGGTYPRKTFRAAFPGFSRGAVAQARRDKLLMSNQDIGPRIESVTPVFGSVKVDALAVGRHARAATARFKLRFRVTGIKKRVVVVQGRLFLSRRSGPWQVFGYDVRKWSRA